MAVDTQGNPAFGVTAGANMLVTTPHLLGVLGPSSDEADATAPLINAAKVPMFADTGEASFDHNKLPYFWRMIPADDVRGYAMALYAKRKGYLRAAAVFGNDVGAQTGVPTLLKGYSEVGGHMVVNQKITLGQTSYLSEVQPLIAARPQVIFTETSPQTNATYLAELQQLGHLIPVIGTDVTIQPQWFTAMAGSIGKSALTQVLRCRAALRPFVGGRVAGVQQGPAGLTPRCPSRAVEHRLVHDDGLRLGPRHGAGRDRGEEHQPGRMECVHPGGHHGLPGAVQVHTYADGVAALNAGKKIDYIGAAGHHRLQQVAQFGRRLPDRRLRAERGHQPGELDHGRPARTSHQVSARARPRHTGPGRQAPRCPTAIWSGAADPATWRGAVLPYIGRIVLTQDYI